MNKILKTDKNPELFRRLFAYAGVTSLAFACSVYRYIYLSSDPFERHYSSEYSTLSEAYPYIVAILIYYFGRLVLLKYISLKKSSRFNGRKASRYAMVCSVPVEVMTWAIIINMLLYTATDCEAWCGWGVLYVFLIIAAGIIAAVIGLIASLVPGFRVHGGK
jgi:Na+-driven multidrug efflux pump